MYKEITSKSNPLIKEITKLKMKKNRDSIFLIEGERFVYEAHKRGVLFRSLLFVEPPSFIDEINTECIQINAEIAQSLSSTVNSSGVFAVIEYTSKSVALPNTNFLILDKVSDPGNLGTIIRTALAFGFKNIYLYNCVDWKNDKVLRSTMGTIFDVNLYECDLNDLQKLSNYTLLKADMGGVDINSYQKPNGILGLILGNEANGISQEIDNLSNFAVSINMQNEVESLNVSIAGAILMNKLVN